MIVYYAGNGLTAKLTLEANANLEQVDELMARDGMQRVTQAEYFLASKPKTVQKVSAL